MTDSSEKTLTETKIVGSKKTLWNIVATSFVALASLYLILFALFPRQNTPSQLLMQALTQKQNRSFWEKWWDTGRVSPQRFVPRLTDTPDFWSLLNRTLKKLSGEFSKAQSDGTPSNQALKWLKERQIRPFDPQQPVDYYLLVGKGFFNAGNYEEAISVFREGVTHASSPPLQGELYRQLGTTYYYAGYQLQPNGLARYNLKQIQLSVKAYEQALVNGVQDGYLFGNMGWGYYLLENYPRSLKYSKMALASTPELKYVEMNLGITYLRIHQFQKAFEAYQRTVSYNPDATEYEGGMRDLKELNREFPGRYPFIHLLLGYLHYQQEHYIQAEDSFQKFINSSFSRASWKQKVQEWRKKMKQ